jgi:AbrB family looped-hinge helix DNA binding protein
MMRATSRMTSKGQITVPKEVRNRLGVEAGDEVEFIEDPEGFRVRRLLIDSAFTAWRGFLKEYAGRSSDDLVNEMRGR